MNLLFTPNHVKLLNSCYPPASALLTAGPDYTPNSQELSRLTYYANNHTGKLNKLGDELEKRLRKECRKAQAGNIRTRASLLITLSIFRSLATECRRDIALLSPTLVASVNATLTAVPSDLEVVARAASVFTAWTTYTDGHLIGADSNMTRDYLAALRRFATLSCAESNDHETRNRTRLIGFAALTGALNSEALYNDSVQFKAQVSTIMRPILVTLLQTNLSVLNEQAAAVKELPISPYLAEFRTRPAIERRAASIHVHVDGDKGPSMEDVSNACLHGLFSLLEHANGSQLGYIMRSSFDNLDELRGWMKLDHCCWFAQKTAEWSQYQYRYAVPTWLVERLLEKQEAPTITSLHSALVAMVTTVFNSSTHLVNLSTSDIISNLITLLMRRTTIDPGDALLPALVECIASLGRHIYYSDQIQDLAGELIGRIAVVEVQGVLGHGKPGFTQSKSQTIRCLLAGLLGLIRTADKNENVKDQDEQHKKPGLMTAMTSSPLTQTPHKDVGVRERASRRTRVPPDIWHDTVSLLCEADYAVRADYSEALVFYLTKEIPKKSDSADADGVKRTRWLAEGPPQQAANKNVLLHAGDFGTKFLNAIHAYIYILATTSSLGLSSSSSPSPAHSSNEDAVEMNVLPATPLFERNPDTETSEIPDSLVQAQGRRSLNLAQPPRSRKFSVVQRLLERAPSHLSASASAYLSDYTHILDVLTAVHEQLPVRGLLTGIPMLLALDGTTRAHDVDDSVTLQRIHTVKEVIAKVWLVVGKVWDSSELVEIAEKAISSMPGPGNLPIIVPSEIGIYHPPREAISFPLVETATTDVSWPGVNAETALMAIVSNANVQQATVLDRQGLLRRFSKKWTADLALRDSVERPAAFDTSVRGDGISPLLKISPALMHIENISLQSLARSTRGVGVTELREALEGRSSMSNPALARRPSISTLDHTPSTMGGESLANRLTQTRSRSRTKKRTIPSGSGEVRDVLNRLGIGKQNGSLLKASFPALQKPDQRAPPYKP